MRIALGEIVQETGSFTPSRMGRAAFEAYGLYQGAELLAQLPGVGPPGGFLQVAQMQDETVEVVPLVRAWAGAGAKILDETSDELLEMLLQPLRDAGQLDAVYLSLHGAASSEREDDLEGAILAAVRDVIGPDVPLVCPLDHHANITARMALHADALVGHETQPHHQFDTGSKAAALLFHALMQGARPTTVFRKLPMVTQQDQYLTAEEPMGEWFRMARALERQPGVPAGAQVCVRA